LQRLAPRSGAEIHHQLATARLHQQTQQLATLVLYLEAPLEKQRVLLQGRLARQPDRLRRQPAGRCGNPLRLQPRQHLIPIGFQQVHAQIERSGPVQAMGQRNQFFLPHLHGKTIGQPVRQIRTFGQRKRTHLGRLHCSDPIPLGGTDQAFEIAQRPALTPRKPRQQQHARGGLLAGKTAQPTQPAQHAIHRLRR